MRLVFAGTPQAAVPALELLLASRHEVAAVLTRPDAPVGRGQRAGGGRQGGGRLVAPGPVADHARRAGLEVLTPPSARDPDLLDRLRRIGPDCCPVVAYGALLPRAALDIPPLGWVNLHFSLLPAWRGAAPVQHAILHGDDITGATTFRLVEELDAGPVLGVVTEPIQPTDTAADLLARLARSGAELLVATLDGIESGHLEARPQPADGVSLAPKITPEDARVNWATPAVAVDRQVRACTPAPGAWTVLRGVRVKLGPVGLATSRDGGTVAARPSGTRSGSPQPGGAHAASPLPVSPLPGSLLTAGLKPGEIRVEDGRVLVGTGTRPVVLGEVRPAGKRAMDAAEWARGLRLSGGERLS
jgi:methionyl-tRNA formyltransferase